ncbi:MAG: hypothetical protein M0Q12_06285 [Synergistaceae bacterium]|jgi:hypothetical protein|nr:hypothetical protein [Synergistaceae bacterium]
MIKKINCKTCQDREDEKPRGRVYCRECGELITKLVKSKTKYCSECGRPYIEYTIECPKKNSFWAGLLFLFWGYHDSDFLKYENLPLKK